MQLGVENMYILRVPVKWTIRMKTVLTVVAGLFLLSSAAAAPTWHTSTIKTIYPLANGDVVITFDADAPTCTNASNPKYYYVRVGENGMNLDGLKHILATALMGAATRSNVTINFDNASTGCFINRLLVSFAN